MTDTPRLRFAPSPTGPLHLGGARTALYNWAAARAMGGKFLLRIEDTDRARSTDESLQIIFEGLRWLGIDWDEGPEVGGDYGPYFQTERLDLYKSYADRLLEAGACYPCYCTPEEVQAGRERLQAEGKNPMYDRAHRDLTPDQRAAFEAEGRTAVLRYAMPIGEEWTLDDLSKGEVKVSLDQLDDWVMMRADGMPTYNFACVVDDAEMKITHVVRGEEHFLNGVKQEVLFRRLGLTPPRYAHIPLILGKNGKKLSKRDAVTNILDYRDQGYLPEAIFNYIALLGWGFSGDRDLFTRDEMVERFEISSIGSSGAKFDDEKLAWMAGDYMRRLSREELVQRARPFLERPFLEQAGAVPTAAYESHPGLVQNALACFQERAQVLSELPDKVRFVFADSLELDADAQKKMAKAPDAPAWLEAYADLLEQSDLPASYPNDRGSADAAIPLPSDKDRPEPTDAPCMTIQAIERQARELVERLGIKFGHFVHPVRAALTGTTRGPGLFDCVFLVGKERCVERLRAAAGASGASKTPTL